MIKAQTKLVIASMQIELEPNHLPAALSLLEEAGDIDTVLR